jgi:hypothetical protein
MCRIENTSWPQRKLAYNFQSLGENKIEKLRFHDITETRSHATQLRQVSWRRRNFWLSMKRAYEVVRDIGTFELRGKRSVLAARLTGASFWCRLCWRLTNCL